MLAVLLGAALAGTSMAVLPFDNHSGSEEYDALGLGIADMLVTDLSGVSELTLVERQKVGAVLSEIELGEQGFLDPEAAVKAGKGVGAEWLLVGAITAVEPELRVDARVIDVSSGTVAHTAAVEGPRTEFFLVEKELALVVLEEMGLEVSPREAARVGRVATESFDAFVAYSAGLEALDSGDVDAARRRFEAALKADSGFASANDAVAGLRDELTAADARSEQLVAEGTEAVLARIAAYADGTIDDDALISTVSTVSMSFYSLTETDQLRVCEALLDLELGEDVILQQMPGFEVSINDWAMSRLVLAASRLNDRTRVLTWGQAFIERYPTSSMYSVVSQSLDRYLKVIETERKARADGVPEALRADAHDTMLFERCNREPDARRAVEHCRKLVEWREETGRVWDRRALYAVFEAAEDVVDEPLMRRILTHWESDQVEPDAVKPGDLDDVREDLAERLEEHLSCPGLGARLDGSEEPDDYDLVDVARDVERAVRRACFDLVDPGLARLAAAPKASVDERVTRAWTDARWTRARLFGDAEALDALYQEFGDRGWRFVDASRIDSIREDRLDTDWANAARLDDLASSLQRAGLFREAALARQEIVDEHEGWPEKSRAAVLLDAANAWRQVLEPDSIPRARALFLQVIEAFPGTPDAERAELYESGMSR